MFGGLVPIDAVRSFDLPQGVNECIIAKAFVEQGSGRITGDPDRTGLETASVGFWKESLPPPWRGCRAGTEQHFSRQRVGHFPVLDDRHAVDQHVFHSDRQAIRVFESCDIANGV